MVDEGLRRARGGFALPFGRMALERPDQGGDGGAREVLIDVVLDLCERTVHHPPLGLARSW